jgi:hypothetical protein
VLKGKGINVRGLSERWCYIPPHIEPVALISLAFTDNYPKTPILEKENWEKRIQINNLIHHDNWNSVFRLFK